MRLGARETGTRELQLESGTVIETITTSDVKPFITVRLSIPLELPASCRKTVEKSVDQLNRSTEHGLYRLAENEKGELMLEMLNSVWRIRETPTIRMCEELMDVYEASIRASYSYIRHKAGKEYGNGTA